MSRKQTFENVRSLAYNSKMSLAQKIVLTLRYDWNPKNAFEVDKVSQKMRFRFQMRMLSYAYCGKCRDPIHLRLFLQIFNQSW